MYQVQKAIPSNTKVMELNFNNPVKFLACSNTTSGSNFFNLTNKIKLQVNGVDISDFKYIVPHFTQAASYYHSPYAVANTQDFFLFPFCLDTSRLQPSGSLNFSRIDTARLISETYDIDNTMYAVNYNILRIENGMGGLMYSN